MNGFTLNNVVKNRKGNRDSGKEPKIRTDVQNRNKTQVTVEAVNLYIICIATQKNTLRNPQKYNTPTMRPTTMICLVSPTTVMAFVPHQVSECVRSERWSAFPDWHVSLGGIESNRILNFTLQTDSAVPTWFLTFLFTGLVICTL